MSISRLTPSLATLHNENTLALASINFDFSIIKLPAPKEFDGLGAALSFRRRDEAENGFQHRTARRLGALFENVLPEVRSLIQAYGKRASEVSASPDINPRGSSKDGVFEHQVGADGTTIWAAATSGPSAIAAHLLACMLARIWPPEESTSLWVEIVLERQKEIEATGASQTLMTRYAAQQHVSRQELAKWDASARAWLRSADQAKYRHQTQLMLIFKNVNLSVNTSMKTYDSVMQAWKLAMTSVNRLVNGESLLVQNGAVLLGLSAWHLYPNLVVLKETSDPVFLKDSLVPESSFLTIGIEDPRITQDGGVHWSLPLGHLRYYGEPVVSSAAVNQEAGRVLMSDFVFVFLGAISKGWDFNGPNATIVLKWFSELWAFFSRALQRLEKNIKHCEDVIKKQGIADGKSQEHEDVTADRQKEEMRQRARLGKNLSRDSSASGPNTEDKPTGRPDADYNTAPVDARRSTEHIDHYQTLRRTLESRRLLRRRFDNLLHGELNWLQILACGAQRILESDGYEHDHRMSLFRLGQRNKTLVTDQKHSKPFFGLLEYAHILPLIPGEERQIHILRQACTKLNYPSSRLVIRYQPLMTFNHNQEPSGQPKRNIDPFRDHDWGRGIGFLTRFVEYELTTAKPRTSAIKRSHDGKIVNGSGHMRWLNTISNNHVSVFDDSSLEELDESESAFYVLKAQQRKQKISSTNEASSTDPQAIRMIGPTQFHWKAPSKYFNSNEEGVISKDTNELTLSVFDFILGDPQRAAVYLMRGGHQLFKRASPTSRKIEAFEIDVAMKMLTDDLFGAGALLEYFDRCPKMFPGLDQYFTSLRAFTSVVKTYEGFSNASMALKVATFPLHNAPWLPETLQDFPQSTLHSLNTYDRDNLSPFPLTRSQAFSCIINFELGCQEVSPHGLDDVLAISSGDSIFVASQLLRDPAHTDTPHGIQRIVGNIGMPGVAMLIAPAAPIIRKPELDRFQIIKHDLFDGQMVDHFGKTQLQLSFTKYERTVDIGIRGGQDKVLFFLEALVTVTDSGEKVADLDVLKALGSQQLIRPSECSCGKSPSSSVTCEDDKKSWPRLISVDNWEEFLERPDGAAVVRAHGNWQARLAAACISVAQGNPTFVLPKAACWKCGAPWSDLPKDSMFIL